MLKDSAFTWENTMDLKGKTIGGTSHTSYALIEDAYEKGIIKFERAGVYEILFKRLLAKRIDAIPVVKNVGNFLIRTTLNEEEQKKITYSPTVIQDKKYYLILTKNIEENKRFIKLFNKGLEIIKKNGVYAKLTEDLNSGKYDKAFEK